MGGKQIGLNRKNEKISKKVSHRGTELTEEDVALIRDRLLRKTAPNFRNA